MPLAATWVDLDIIILSEESQRKTIPYDITSVWNLKYNTNELIYKIETDSQTENEHPVTKGERQEGGIS